MNSVVRGPAIIGEGCEIRDAYIGPYTSVGDGCKVLGSEVEHSILLRDCACREHRVAPGRLAAGRQRRRAPQRPGSSRRRA